MTSSAATASPRPGSDLPPPPADLLRGASLFLDFDGTLVEIAHRPDAVEVDAKLHALMRRLADALNGRIAIVSGRSARQIAELFGEACFAISGSHGMELHWADGHVETPDPPKELEEILAAMRELAARHPGVLVEAKPLGVGLHFREAPAAESACRALAEDLAERHGMTLQEGKMLFEVRASGGDKGVAIEAFMRAEPFAGTRAVFLGDDVTDEDGFRAVATLGGAGILVGPARPTAARFRLDGVRATLDWLEAAWQAVA